MNENEKIIKLEAQLDKIETERFTCTQDLEREKIIRYELEEMVRMIYNDCQSVLKQETKPDVDVVLKNLSST
ncbi:MAG: hypothetical protein L3J29_10555 [Cyclobacteriaceae bacterium]|nr:hypothetical protein [Cyclobacteriaceae bacterium]